mgnify:CR=1 FL=1
MFDDPIESDHSTAFEPVAFFHRFGAQKVFYKGKAPKQKETAEEKAFADVSRKRWEHYKNTYRPLENKFIDSVDEQNSEGSFQFARGNAASSTRAAFETTREGQRDNLQKSGVNPNSGKYKTEVAGLADAEARSSADTQGRAQTSQQDDYIRGVQNVQAIGRGQATNAQAGMGNMAGIAQREAASDARNEFNDRAARNSAVGSVVGTGAVLANQGLSDARLKNGTFGSRKEDYTGADFQNWVDKQRA